MKKLSRTAWLVIGIGIFVIAFAALYMLYNQQNSEKRRLEDSIVVAEGTTAAVATEKRDAESQLTKLNGQLTQVKTNLTQAWSELNSSMVYFPETVESIEYGERLFYIADGWDLKIISLTCSEPKLEEIEDISFSITSLVINVRGLTGNIMGFINTVATDADFTNATVELVDIRVPGPLTDEEKAELTEEQLEEIGSPSATINLTIYGYREE